jgi:hypothetical protein
MKRFGCMVAMVICLCLPTVARAEDTADQFLARYDAAPTPASKLVWTQYIETMETGFGWANAVLSDGGGKPLYCVPPKVVLTGEQLIDILRRYIEEVKTRPHAIGSQLLGLVLLQALRDAFPCAQ